jgi:hypothetical protein
MRTLKKIILGLTLSSIVAACYVAPAHPYYYAHRGCGPGWFWNGYRCIPYRY